MKGIILAGGSGTRLYPVTRALSKQLIPVYNKPMVYYPLSSLLFAGIREVLLISTPEDVESYKRLLGDGAELGLEISYAVQEKPEGLAQAFLIGKEFIGSGSVSLALGDNIFYGHDVPREFAKASKLEDGAIVFGYQVLDPERYGVVDFDDAGNVTEIFEKPSNPPSSFAVTGIYFYDNQVVSIAENLKPSPRGELEITDVNREYLTRKQLKLIRLGRGTAWLDTGTHDSLLQASTFVQTIEERQGLMVGCIEEIAYRKGFMSKAQFKKVAEALAKSSYGQYLLRILEEDSPSVSY